MANELRTSRELIEYTRGLGIREIADMPLINAVQPVELVGDATHLVRLAQAPILGGGGFVTAANAGVVTVAQLRATSRPLYVTAVGNLNAIFTEIFADGADSITANRIAHAAGLALNGPLAILEEGSIGAVPTARDGFLLDAGNASNFMMGVSFYLEPGQVLRSESAVAGVTTFQVTWIEIP